MTSMYHIGLMSIPWSWLKLGCLRMRRASFTLRLNQFFSLYWWQCCLPSQSCGLPQCYAVSTSPFWQFFLCSDSLVLRVLPVFHTYEWSQSKFLFHHVLVQQISLNKYVPISPQMVQGRWTLDLAQWIATTPQDEQCKHQIYATM